MGVSYATRSDVFGVGVPRGALVRPARLIKSVDTTQDAIELEGHGLAAGDSIEFTVSGSGVLPSPLAQLTVYYAKLITLGDTTTDENRFQASASVGGPAIDLTTAGTQPMSVAVPTGPMIDRYLEEFSRWADGKLVNHVAPLVAPYPSWVTRIVALRTAIAVATELGRRMPGLEQRERDAIADFITQAKVPLRDSRATAPANVALSRSSASGRISPRRVLP